MFEKLKILYNFVQYLTLKVVVFHLGKTGPNEVTLFEVPSDVGPSVTILVVVPSYLKSINSTSKTRVALGGITPDTPLAP